MNTDQLVKALKNIIQGEVSVSTEDINSHKRDASIFEMTPQIVVYPKDTKDIENLVLFVNTHKKDLPNLSITARAAGTDMTGGTLTDSISMDVKHFNKILEINKDNLYTIVEPGVYYRDFEKRADTMKLVYPSYPASKNLCTFGGIVNNNSGGELSLRYGKTEKYVKRVNMVLRDGKLHTFEKIKKDQLNEKMKQSDIEGEIYRRMYKLLEDNYDIIRQSTPTVTKNSTGYNIWHIWDREYFDMSQVFIGAQGTLGLLTEAKVDIIQRQEKNGLLILFLKDFNNIPEIVNTVLSYNPISFESFDNYTLKLALKFFVSFAKLLGKNAISMPIQFFPEFLLVALRGMPRLILLVEFDEDSDTLINQKISHLSEDLKKYKNMYFKKAQNQGEIDKYFAIRRESFNLLRSKIKNLKAASFIDDIIVHPKDLTEFLPQLYEILDKEKLIYTIAGHIGDGNFHIIPLMDLKQKSERDKIFRIADTVFDLVLKYKGSISAEHNEGLIRSPYTKEMYGDKIYEIFQEIKNIFDPDRIFNPYKKTNITKEFSYKHIIQD